MSLLVSSIIKLNHKPSIKPAVETDSSKTQSKIMLKLLILSLLTVSNTFPVMDMPRVYLASEASNKGMPCFNPMLCAEFGRMAGPKSLLKRS